MQKLSMLTFSRNHLERLYGLIDDLYDTVDDIVVMDSSDRKDREEFYAMKKKKKWSKVRIYYIVPMNFMELYRPYGLGKCRHDWVLYMCVDERTSEQLKADIKKIISDTKCAAFNLNRFENVGEKESKSDYFTFQTQLIRKSKVRYKGLIDERPEVNGKVCMLDASKYYIRHVTELMRQKFNEYYTTNKFTKYDCMSYSDLNNKMLENYARTRGKSPDKVRDGISWRLTNMLIRAYEVIGFKKLDREISPFDYYAYAVIRTIGFGLKNKSISTAITAPFTASANLKVRAKLRSDEDHKRAFAISRIIIKEGMVKFLNLTDEKTISELNRKYKDNKEGLAGLSLLTHLLEQRYTHMQKYKYND